MANVDRAIGLRPLRHLGGGEVRSNAYNIASGYATALGAGDPVKMTGTGRNIARAAGGDVVVGVFDGCKYTTQSGERKFSMYWPAGMVATEIEALVYDDPMISFRVQADTIAEADVGLLADLDDATPSAVTGCPAWSWRRRAPRRRARPAGSSGSSTRCATLTGRMRMSRSCSSSTR